MYTCDRCRRPIGLPWSKLAATHIDLRIGEETLEVGTETEHVAIQRRRVDLCAPCLGRAIDYLTDGMGYAQATAFLAFATEAPELVAVSQKEPV